jgi:hypothetical protein
VKARSRCSLLLLLTVMGVAGVVASAQAQAINPPDTNLMLFADDPTFGPVTCDTGTLSGRTGSDQDSSTSSWTSSATVTLTSAD